MPVCAAKIAIVRWWIEPGPAEPYANWPGFDLARAMNSCSVRAGRTDLDRNVLVVEPELFRDPQRAKGAGAGDAVDAQVGHRSLN